MALQRWDPFREVLSLRDAINRLFEESWVSPTSIVTRTTVGMPVDIEERDNEYVIKASLPGFKPEDVNVSVTGDTVTISAEQKGEEERKGANYLVRERRFGSVSRSFTLPTRIDANNAKATFEHGELVLTLPKAEEAKPKQIQINVGGQLQSGQEQVQR